MASAYPHGMVTQLPEITPESLAPIRFKLEFLLSDSNLHKDGHLRSLINKHRGFIPLQSIAAFKSVATIPACDITSLAHAVLLSPSLRLSHDGLYVCRATPFVMAPADAYDDRTIYVENFPLNSTHDELAGYFRRWGRVTYVSMPRHRGNRR